MLGCRHVLFPAKLAFFQKHETPKTKDKKRIGNCPTSPNVGVLSAFPKDPASSEHRTTNPAKIYI
jgi:hypothetical protein